MAGIINNQQSLIFSFNHGKLIVKDICEEYNVTPQRVQNTYIILLKMAV